MTDTLPQRIEAAEGADRARRQCMNCPTPVTGHVMLCQQCFDDDQAYYDCGGCANCAYARTGFMCARGEKPYRQDYERQYTDSDFCGPFARYFKGKDHP